MLKSIDTKLSAVLVVAVFAVMMIFGPTSSNFQKAFAHYGVDIDQCKDDEDYYDDHENACDKNLQAHYGEDYNGDFGSKNINSNNNDDDDDDDGNRSNQGIGQSQSSRQNSQCVSGGDTNDSCNNLSFQNQENSGNNAAGQQGGGDDDDDGNRSNQGIGQSQSSRQNSQCVAGGSLGNSCNNLSFQNQENSGNNAAGQQGGGDDDDDGNGNRSNQGIGQNQDSKQNAQCVSGEDAIVSCDNVSFQNQVNSGNNALAQD